MEQSFTYSFSFYPWQLREKTNLFMQRQNNRLSHAYLLVGMKGLGKLSFSYAFAAYLLCENASDMGACGGCKSCKLLSAESHPDLFFIAPEKEGGNIKVDQVRQLGDFINKTAQRSGNRVIIINDSDAMNIPASNALLKSLEEPGRDTVLLLISNSPDELLPTIRSRCQLISFKPPEQKSAAEWLDLTINDEQRSATLLREANGSPLLALSYFSDVMYQDRDIILEDLEALLMGTKNPVELASAWKNYAVLSLLRWWYAWLIDLAKLAGGSDPRFVQNVSQLTRLQSLSQGMSLVEIYKFSDILSENIALIKRGGNLNQQLLLESLLITWLKLRS